MVLAAYPRQGHHAGDPARDLTKRRVRLARVLRRVPHRYILVKPGLISARDELPDLSEFPSGVTTIIDRNRFR